MARREVAQLVKEAAEQKISSKNAWHSTLIDDFENVEQFREKETDSTNFQQASVVLDGCIRVYSTRVDNVAEEADRLMESVGRASSPQNTALKTKERTHPTIEHNEEAIAMKKKVAVRDNEVLEHISRETKEGDTRGLLLHILKWKEMKGIQLLHNIPGKKYELEICAGKQEPPADIDIGLLLPALEKDGMQKWISPMFANFSPEKDLSEVALPTYKPYISHEASTGPPHFSYAYAAGTDVEIDAAMAEYDAYSQESHGTSEEQHGEEDVVLENLQDIRLSITPFGYVKGWAGPAHWKVNTGRTRKHKEKQKEKKKAIYIDFVNTQDIPLEQIFEKDPKVVLTAQQITERRKNSHSLPEDQKVCVEDLYRLLLYPGHFYSRAYGSHAEANTGSHTPCIYGQEEGVQITHNQEETWETGFGDPNMEDVALAYPQEEENVYPEKALLEVPTLNNSERAGAAAFQDPRLARHLLQSTLRRTRKNDIVKVKQSMWAAIQEGESEVMNLCTKPETKDVSAQFCLVSLLHLANEKRLVISPADSGPTAALNVELDLAQLRVSKIPTSPTTG